MCVCKGRAEKSGKHRKYKARDKNNQSHPSILSLSLSLPPREQNLNKPKNNGKVMETFQSQTQNCLAKWRGMPGRAMQQEKNWGKQAVQVEVKSSHREKGEPFCLLLSCLQEGREGR